MPDKKCNIPVMINEIWSARNWWTIKLFTAVSTVHLPLSNKQLRALPSCFLHYSKVLQTRMCCCWLNQRCQVPQFPHGQPNSAENRLNLRLRRKKGKLKICHCSLFKTTLSKWRLRGWTLKQKEVSSIKWLQKLTSCQFDSLIQCPLIILPPPPATQSRLTRVRVLNQMDVGCWNIKSLTPFKIFHSEKLYFWNK